MDGWVRVNFEGALRQGVCCDGGWKWHFHHPHHPGIDETVSAPIEIMIAISGAAGEARRGEEDLGADASLWGTDLRLTLGFRLPGLGRDLLDSGGGGLDHLKLSL